MFEHKMIINFTPTGMIPTKELTPRVPLRPNEIIAEVLAARHYGVSMVHLHARDEEGKPTYHKEVYQEIIDGIRAVDGHDENSLVICVSTSGRNWNEFEKRSECLELEGVSKPDMASLTLSSLNFNKQASVNAPDMIMKLAAKMKERGIKPELEAFDLGMINYAHYLIKKDLVTAPYYFNLILGNIACAQADPMHLGLMINELPEHSYWSVGGIGDSQLKMNMMGIISGGGVRVGLEDNIWFSPHRDRLATNMELLERIHAIAHHLNVQVATPKEAREILALNHKELLSQ